MLSATCYLLFPNKEGHICFFIWMKHDTIYFHTLVANYMLLSYETAGWYSIVYMDDCLFYLVTFLGTCFQIFLNNSTAINIWTQMSFWSVFRTLGLDAKKWNYWIVWKLNYWILMCSYYFPKDKPADNPINSGYFFPLKVIIHASKLGKI